MILLFVLMIVAMYFLLIRPQQKRKREQQQMQSSASVGAEIMTLGGLYGTIVDVDDDTITLEVSPGVINKYAKGAIARVVTPAEQVEADEDEDLDEDVEDEYEAQDDEHPAEADDSSAETAGKQEVGAAKTTLPRDPTAN